jgi:hypothetical protein
MGWEEGVRGGARGRAASPVTPHPVPPPRAGALASAARRLQRDAARALVGAAAPIAVRVTAAAVTWSSQEARGRRRSAEDEPACGACFVGAATLLVGTDPAAPAWSRTAQLAGDLSGQALGHSVAWPAGWLEAVARETAVISNEVCRTGAICAGPSFETPFGTLLADAFAAGDLLRLEALRSARAGRAGGLAVAGLADGVWVRERRTPSRPPAGSWRSDVDPPWEELVLGVERRAPWPDEGFVLTRLVPLRGALLGAGHLLRGARAVARWGPAAIPPPAWWLARIAAALGEPVADATGPPIACPPLLIAWGRRGGPR